MQWCIKNAPTWPVSLCGESLFWTLDSTPCVHMYVFVYVCLTVCLSVCTYVYIQYNALCLLLTTTGNNRYSCLLLETRSTVGEHYCGITQRWLIWHVCEQLQLRCPTETFFVSKCFHCTTKTRCLLDVIWTNWNGPIKNGSKKKVVPSCRGEIASRWENIFHRITKILRRNVAIVI